MKVYDFVNPNYQEVFVMFSTSHIVSIFVFLLAIVTLYTQRKRINANQLLKDRVRYIIIAALMLPESCLDLWYVFEKMWDIRYTLPLELCSITLVLSIIMLFNRSFLLYQILYFAGIGGALQAIITPNLSYPFPHFRFFHFFIVHFSIILAILYMTWIENYKPTWKSIGITMIFLNVILVLVGSIDSLLHANYMFLLHKPDTVSILDFLGPYPYYLIFEELIAIVIFIVIYLPFIIGRKKIAILSK